MGKTKLIEVRELLSSPERDARRKKSEKINWAAEKLFFLYLIRFPQLSSILPLSSVILNEMNLSKFGSTTKHFSSFIWKPAVSSIV